jgi:hypothetical protein
MIKKVTWTPEIDEALELLMASDENFTFETMSDQLTKQFGLPFTRNACIGRAHRLRLPPRPPRPRTEARTRPSRKVITMPVRVDAPIVPKEALRRNGRELTLIQLEQGLCKWTGVDLETNPPYTYCGKPTTGGLSYCPGHYVRVYHPAKKTFA